MGKKSKKNSQSDVILESSQVLPKNIISIGDRVLTDKNIYIHQSAYKSIKNFTKNKTENESGGILVGKVIEDLGKTNILIYGFIEAKYCEATPTTLTFTHRTWDYVHEEMEQKYKEQKIVGWIHTHPDFGIFLSEYDRFIHDNFFKEPYQVAYVIDPIQQEEGFYYWINDHIEKCPGFYIFDEIGKNINAVILSDSEQKDSDEKIRFTVSGILIAGLFALVFILFVNLLGLKGTMNDLNHKVSQIDQGAGQQLYILQEQIKALEGKLAKLQSVSPEIPAGNTTSSKSNNPSKDSNSSSTVPIESSTPSHSTETASPSNPQ